MNHSGLHRALQDPEYTSVSLGVVDPQGNAQTISILRSPPRLNGSIDFELHDLHANAYFEMHFFRASFISSFIRKGGFKWITDSELPSGDRGLGEEVLLWK